MQFEGFDAAEARAFAERWLPAWSGDRPELLASFYCEDTFYSDPAIPQGVRGREALLAYFRQLRGGLIASNQVFFDRSDLLAAIRAARPSR